MDLVLAVDVEKPPVTTISPGGIAASIPGQIAVYARDNGTQHFAFTLGLVRVCVSVNVHVCLCVSVVCVCVRVCVCNIYVCVCVCVYTCVFASVLLCLVSWCVSHTTPHHTTSAVAQLELTLFLVYNTTSMYCPNLWSTAQHALCPNVPLPLHLAPLLYTHMVPFPVQMIHTDVTVGTHDRGGRINITAEAKCIKWVKKIHHSSHGLLK